MRLGRIVSLVGLLWTHSVGATAPAMMSGAAIGAPDAAQVVVEYSSLTCGHCAKFHREVLPILEERYIATGQLRLEFHHYPLDGIALQLAALVDHATPIKRFHLISKLFETQDQWIKAEDPVKAAAGILGIPDEEAAAITGDKAALDRIVVEVLDAHQQRHIEATPSFIISGRLYPHALQLEAFEVAMGDRPDPQTPQVIHVSEPLTK
ncbi:MAG: thioredoxin domain-containing protein [Holosporales bacterium]